MSENRQTELLSIGQAGSTMITDTAVNTGSWRLIIPIENTVFTTLTDAKLDGNIIAGETFPANFRLYGKFREGLRNLPGFGLYFNYIH
jgi:hypothetical protein